VIMTTFARLLTFIPALYLAVGTPKPIGETNRVYTPAVDRETTNAMKAADSGLVALDAVGFQHVAERCTRQARRVVRYHAIIGAHGTPIDVKLLETSGEAACDIAVLDALRVSKWKPCTKAKGCDVNGYLSLGSAEHRRENSTELTFERVLQVARGKTIDAKKRVEKVRDEACDEQLRVLARRILGRWDDDAKTYYSKTPQALESTCIDTDELKRLLQREVDATRVYVEVRVDADGRPVRASVTGGTEDKQLKDAIVHSLMQKRYVPAKENDHYVDATLTVECRIEVR